jgi:hypothetical protein
MASPENKLAMVPAYIMEFVKRENEVGEKNAKTAASSS